MNFIYSFTTNKPKKIFLVHGEEASQEVFKEKIEQEANIETVIPMSKDEYVLDGEEVELVKRVHIEENTEEKDFLVRIESLVSKLGSMKKEIKTQSLSKEEQSKINDKIKMIEEQIKTMF